MMNKSHLQFPLFQNHLDVAHRYWKKLVRGGDCVVDATCGNGFDALQLCQLALTPFGGSVWAVDRQSSAIAATRSLLNGNLPPSSLSKVFFSHQCHSLFPAALVPESVKLIVYNLGYLPRSDKSITTNVETTLQSISAARELIIPGGAICITCYPGHPEGALEEEALLSSTATLPREQWSCTHQRWINRRRSPSVLLMQRSRKH